MNERQRRFIAEYLIDLNGKQAAIRAGYPKTGAARRACLLLRHPEIKAAVEMAVAKRSAKAQITADRVLEEYARIAFADIRRVTEWGPDGVKLKPQSALTDDDAAAIAEISPTGGGRIKLYDKKSALDAIARHLGMFGARRSLGLDENQGPSAREILRQRIAKLREGL